MTTPVTDARHAMDAQPDPAIRPDQVVLATEVYLGAWARSYQSAKRSTDANALFFFADDADIDPLVAHQIRKGQGKEVPGKRFRLFLVECDDDQQGDTPNPVAERPYGQQARQLKRSGFCRVPEVWRALGSDAVFREWVSHQPSVVSRQFGEHDENGDGRNVACHVRRADESGIAYKPDYSCVPMTVWEHRVQHQHGEAECLRQYREAALPRDVSRWFDEQRIKTVEAWAWLALKTLLGHESMGDVAPHAIANWAADHGLERYLPGCYRGVEA